MNNLRLSPAFACLLVSFPDPLLVVENLFTNYQNGDDRDVGTIEKLTYSPQKRRALNRECQRFCKCQYSDPLPRRVSAVLT